MPIPLLPSSSSSANRILAGTAFLDLGAVGSAVVPVIVVPAAASIRLLPAGASISITSVVVPASPSAQERLAALAGRSHQPRARIATLTDGRIVRTTYNPATVTLSGSVSSDRRREVRRSGDLVLVDRDGSLSPTVYGDEFAQGELVRIERGARIDGANVYDLLAVLEVVTFRTGSGQLSLSLEDPSTALQQDVGETLVLASGATAEAVVRQLWEPVLGDGSAWELDGDGMTLTESRTINEDDDRLHVVVELMADMGLDVYFSRSGYPVLRPATDPNTAPTVRTYRQERGEALAERLERSGDQRPYNRTVVIGESPTGALIRAVADITDPSSPLHRDRIGLRAAPVYRSAQITTQHQANQVARARLIEASLWADSVVWVGVPDPELEAGDVIRVVDMDSATDARYRIERVQIPVAMGAMTMEASRVVPLFEASA